MDMKTEALNPKWWLVITALIHTVLGVLMELDPDNDNELMVAGIMLIIPVYMLYAAFMNEGRAQARLAAVIARAMLVGVCSFSEWRRHANHRAKHPRGDTPVEPVTLK